MTACGVIAFVSHGAALQDNVAIKFYSDPLAFSNEQKIYSNAKIAEVVGGAPVLLDNADGRIQAPSGFVFPPHSVADKGQPLQQWLTLFEADFVTSMQVILRSAPLSYAVLSFALSPLALLALALSLSHSTLPHSSAPVSMLLLHSLNVLHHCLTYSVLAAPAAVLWLFVQFLLRSVGDWCL
jgi:hypothetical protein